jgi:hypothetical protein
MTLDEAIEHARLCADESVGKCSEEHRQLAEWLEELKRLEEKNAKLREFAKYAIYCAEGDLKCEGCLLRDKSNTEQVICGMHRIARELGIEVEA